MTENISKTAQEEIMLANLFETYKKLGMKEGIFPDESPRSNFVYVNGYACCRLIEPGKWKWQHFKGDYFEVIGVASFPDLEESERPSEFLSEFLGVYVAEETKQRPERLMLLKLKESGRLIYTANRDYGQRVFYKGSHGQWAREIMNFLGLVGPEHPEHYGKLRFEKSGNA